MSFEDFTAREIELLTSGVRLRPPTKHTSIFKYVALNTKTSWAHLEATLQDLALTGSTATSLNDPFELSPYIFDDLRPSVVAAAIGKTSVNALTESQESSVAAQFNDLEPYRLQARGYLDKLVRDSRIISFCERSDSPLLWSHYAHSYEGACLHLLGRAFRPTKAQVGYVTYSSYRPTYPLSLALALSNAPSASVSSVSRQLLGAESEKLYFFTKASDWGYETEVRIVYNVNRMRNVPFDQDGLVAIILGPRMSDENKARVQRLIQTSRVPRLAIRRARLSTNSFSVEID